MTDTKIKDYISYIKENNLEENFNISINDDKTISSNAYLNIDANYGVFTLPTVDVMKYMVFVDYLSKTFFALADCQKAKAIVPLFRKLYKKSVNAYEIEVNEIINNITIDSNLVDADKIKKYLHMLFDHVKYEYSFGDYRSMYAKKFTDVAHIMLVADAHMSLCNSIVQLQYSREKCSFIEKESRIANTIYNKSLRFHSFHYILCLECIDRLTSVSSDFISHFGVYADGSEYSGPFWDNDMAHIIDHRFPNLTMSFMPPCYYAIRQSSHWFYNNVKLYKRALTIVYAPNYLFLKNNDAQYAIFDRNSNKYLLNETGEVLTFSDNIKDILETDYTKRHKINGLKVI